MKTTVRKATLDEWFLIHQLDYINDRLHVPFYADVDISKLHDHYTDQNKKVPYTALLIKAASILLKERPEVNRALFKTIFGPKFVDFNYNAVNFPISVQREGKYMLTAGTIKDAYSKSIKEIKAEIKELALRPLDKLPVNKFIHSHKNNFINRLKLKLIHFFLYNFPGNYIKHGGGGISVTSLMNINDSAVPLSIMGYGMTSITIASCTVHKIENSTYMKLGLSMDHHAHHGEFGVSATQEFCRILQATNEKYFSLLTN